MTPLFDDRERAAENRYAHGEELRFLSRREGGRALGEWAAARLGVPAEAYAAGLVDAVLAGAAPAALVARVGADFERAGVTEAAGTPAEVLDRATADAHAKLHDLAGTSAAPEAGTQAGGAARHRQSF